MVNPMRLMIMALLLVACSSEATPLPVFDPTATINLVVVAQQATVVPTADAMPSHTPTIPATATLIPTNTVQPTQGFTAAPTQTFTLIPTNTPRVSPTPLPTETLTPFPTSSVPTVTSIPSATPTNPGDPLGTPLPTWTPPPRDPATQLADHYYLGRPIADGLTNWVDRTYPYGGTAGGRFQIHHGVEFINPRGTRILAAADGTVFYAGDDLTTLFGPIPNYYGNVVVVQHNFPSPEGQAVYTLYGHMDQIVVGAGQAVAAGDVLGNVGATGVALGPHLHFEVRVGDPYSFGATRNPELWIRPYPRYGTLAGRVTDANGNRLYDVTLQVQSQDISRYAFSYAGDEVNPDPAFGENFTLGDLPANYYTVTVGEGGRVRFRQIIYVYPNSTTWIDVRLN